MTQETSQADGFTAHDMADQGAKQFAEGVRVGGEPVDLRNALARIGLIADNNTSPAYIQVREMGRIAHEALAAERASRSTNFSVTTKGEEA